MKEERGKGGWGLRVGVGEEEVDDDDDDEEEEEEDKEDKELGGLFFWGGIFLFCIVIFIIFGLRYLDAAVFQGLWRKFLWWVLISWFSLISLFLILGLYFCEYDYSILVFFSCTILG